MKLWGGTSPCAASARTPMLVPSPRSEPSARSQAGVSLVETLLAIVIVSILLLGIMAGLTTTAKVSANTGQVSATRNALASVIERASSAGWPGCAAAGTINTAMHDPSAPAYVLAPEGYEYEVTSVRSAFPDQSGCSTSPATTAVLLSIRVRHIESGNTLSGDVVLRNKAARP